jgi:hypothetical protein
VCSVQDTQIWAAQDCVLLFIVHDTADQLAQGAGMTGGPFSVFAKLCCFLVAQVTAGELAQGAAGDSEDDTDGDDTWQVRIALTDDSRKLKSIIIVGGR